MTHLRWLGFRYAPAVGGAENYSRRLLREIGDRVDIDVVTLLTSNRVDWLRALIDGDRDSVATYEIDGRRVTALGRWPAATRRKLRVLSPFYHLPSSCAPSAMGRLLAPHMEPVAAGTNVMHNVFMGREAFSYGAMLAVHRAGLPFVFTPLRHQRPLGWNSPAFRTLYRRSDAVIALTEGEAAWLESQGAPRQRLHVIGIGPQNDPEASPTPAMEALGGHPRIVLFLGQLHEYKGFQALLGAARLLESKRDVLFVFAGPDVRGNARRFERAGTNVRWLRMVDDTLRDSLLSACYAVCVPSSRESFGSVVIEAWASGKPVVGGPASATRELIENGVDGWAVAQDPAAIAARLEQLLDDENMAREMGCRGKDKVARRFSWDSVAQAHLDVYERVLASTRGD
ncbi:MAG: glycosyltransferase family 4 protein [Candidatus Dormibacteraceae bacterium]